MAPKPEGGETEPPPELPLNNEQTPTEPAKRAASTPQTRRSRRRESASGSSADAPTNGADLERRVARVEFAEGALARLRVPVVADAEQDRRILTDIDVLAIDVDLRLRVSVAIHECKSGTGESGEPELLFWLAGFERYVQADRSTLVRQTATRRGQGVARRLGIRMLDYPTLERRELAHAWLPAGFAHVAGAGCYRDEARTDRQLKALPAIPSRLVSYLRYDALLVAPYRTVSALLALRSSVEKQGGLPTPTGEILAGHALMALLVAAIKDAAQLDVVPLDTLRGRLETALTVGRPDDTHVLEVLRNADTVVGDLVERIHQAYAEQGAVRIAMDLPSLRMIVAEPPTDAIDQYLDLVERLRSNPQIARDILQTVELACFDALTGDQAWKAEAFDHLFTSEHRQLVLAAARVLGHVAGEQIARRLDPLSNLPFDRVAPAMPRRREKSSQ